MDHSIGEAERQRRRTERARKGGEATLAKHGADHYRRIGQLGGRPTFWESLARARLNDAENRNSRPKLGRPRATPPSGGSGD